MIFPSIPELRIVTVLNRGVANEECIALLAEDRVNTASYFLVIAYSQEGDGSVVPYRDSTLWLGNQFLEAGDWLYVYTGSGTFRKGRTADEKNDMYVVHWGRDTTIFANSNVVPVLFRIDALNIGEKPRNTRQLPLLPGRS